MFWPDTVLSSLSIIAAVAATASQSPRSMSSLRCFALVSRDKELPESLILSPPETGDKISLPRSPKDLMDPDVSLEENIPAIEVTVAQFPVSIADSSSRSKLAFTRVFFSLRLVSAAAVAAAAAAAAVVAAINV